MIDSGTLDSPSTDRQILFKLIALLPSLITVQHRDRSPSSTACRNGSPCSYRPRCWFSHAVSPPVPCFSSGNAFGSLSPRRRRQSRRRPPGRSAVRHDAPLPPPPTSSSLAALATLVLKFLFNPQPFQALIFLPSHFRKKMEKLG